MPERFMRLVPWLLALAMLVSACGQAPTSTLTPPATEVPSETKTTPAVEAPSTTPMPAPVKGGTIRRALASEPPTLDPHGPQGSGQNVILPYIFDTLVFRDADNTYKPYLAESWEVSADGLSWTFVLREGVLFHDGTPLDADAVAFTFERFKERGQANPLAADVMNITSIEVPDARTVVFHLSEPMATFLDTLAMPYAGIISPSAAQKAGEEFGGHPVGSGAFRLAEWQAGVSITLERNPDYHWPPPAVENAGPPHIEKAVFSFIPVANTQVSAMQAGEVDIVFINEPAQIEKLRDDENVDLHEITLNSLIYLGFNCQRPPFDDVRVRQALSHAVNKAEIIQGALGGFGEEAVAFLPPTLLGFDPTLKDYALNYDPEKAVALLEEAGFTRGEDGTWARDGQTLQASLLTSTRPPNETIATILQAQLAAIGVPVDIQQLDARAAQNAASAGEHDLLLWRYDWNDPDVLNIYLSSPRIGNTNRVFYSNPTVDELLAQGKRELDAAKRHEIYVEAQKILLEEAPLQPLYVPKDMIAIRKAVQGVHIGSMGRILLNDAWKAAD